MNYLKTQKRNSKNVYRSTFSEDLYILGIIISCIIIPELVEFLANILFKI